MRPLNLQRGRRQTPRKKRSKPVTHKLDQRQVRHSAIFALADGAHATRAQIARAMRTGRWLLHLPTHQLVRWLDGAWRTDSFASTPVDEAPE